jgi:hypothetical protein
MSQYSFIVPSDTPNLPSPLENIEVRPVDSEQERNTEFVDTKYNPLTIKSFFNKIHSLLQNDFYEPLFQVLLEENQQFLEKAYFLECLYDIDKHFGDQDEYLNRISNLFKLLNLKPSINFLSIISNIFYNEDYSPIPFPSEEKALDLRNTWIRDYINSSYIQKKWAGSLKAYNYLFSSMYKHGSATLRSMYTDGGIFTPFTNKFFKLTDYFSTNPDERGRQFLKLIPDTLISQWPNSVNIKGLSDYSNLSNLIYYKYDTNKRYDENLETPEVIRYDTGIVFGAAAKGIILDIASDITLEHKNSLGTEQCLMDNHWLIDITNNLESIKRCSDTTMVGSQISLVASNSGYFITDSSKQIRDEELYTHPNIKAKFQIFKDNWQENNNVHYVKVGIGNLDKDPLNPVFVSEGILPVAPLDIDIPIFESRIGQYETNKVSNYSAITTLIHKNTFIKQKLNVFEIKLGGWDGVPEETIIKLPHTAITEGSCSFSLPLTFTVEGIEETRTLLFEEKFNTFLNKYMFTLTVLNTKNLAITEENKESPVDFVVDLNMTKDGEYVPVKNDMIIKIIPIGVDEDSYAIIDYAKGELHFKIQIDIDSKLGEDILYKDNIIVAVQTMTCSYTTNSIRGIVNPSDSDVSSIVGITEVGVFNADDKMVAYGTFPPIIYDTEKYHLTLNLLLENP